MQLILFSGMLNQLYNWILREPILLWVPMVLTLSLYTMMTWFMRVKLALGSFILIQKGILVITQGCTGDNGQGI